MEYNIEYNIGQYDIGGSLTVRPVTQQETLCSGGCMGGIDLLLTSRCAIVAV